MISIIIPTFNRAESLKATIESIFNTCNSSLFELIICDNNSTDDTYHVTSIFTKQHSNCFYLKVLEPGLHAGRHAGLQKANNKILSYLDDDVLVQQGWLQAVLDSFNTGASLVGGKVLPNFVSVPPNWIAQEWAKKKMIPELSIIDLGDEKIEIPTNYVFGCNFSILKKVVIDAGGFHPDGMPGQHKYFRGDGESYISEFIYKKKLKCIYHPEACVLHEVSENRMSENYFEQRSFREGISFSYIHVRENPINFLFIARKILSFYRFKWSSKSHTLRVRQRQYFLKGYIMHHLNCMINTELKKWVRQPNYLN